MFLKCKLNVLYTLTLIQTWLILVNSAHISAKSVSLKENEAQNSQRQIEKEPFALLQEEGTLMSQNDSEINIADRNFTLRGVILKTDVTPFQEHDGNITTILPETAKPFIINFTTVFYENNTEVTTQKIEDIYTIGEEFFDLNKEIKYTTKQTADNKTRLDDIFEVINENNNTQKDSGKNQTFLEESFILKYKKNIQNILLEDSRDILDKYFTSLAKNKKSAENVSSSKMIGNISTSVFIFADDKHNSTTRGENNLTVPLKIVVNHKTTIGNNTPLTSHSEYFISEQLSESQINLRRETVYNTHSLSDTVPYYPLDVSSIKNYTNSELVNFTVIEKVCQNKLSMSCAKKCCVEKTMINKEQEYCTNIRPFETLPWSLMTWAEGNNKNSLFYKIIYNQIPNKFSNEICLKINVSESEQNADNYNRLKFLSFVSSFYCTDKIYGKSFIFNRN